MRAGSILLLTVAALGAAFWLVLENDDDVSETYTPTPQPTLNDDIGNEIDPGSVETAPGTGQRPSEPDVILLTGVVKDREGKPLANARVQVLRDERRVAHTRSRTNGRFILEGPAGLLPLVLASADDHASRTFRDLPVGSELIIVLEPAVAFWGGIQDAGGNPMGQATIAMQPHGRPDLAPVSVESGPQGRFRVRTVAPGRWNVTVSKDGFAPIHDAMLVIPPPEGLERDYVLDTGITLRGTVTTDRGNLVVSGAQIEVIDRIVRGRPVQNQSRRLGPYVSKGDGSFEIPALLPGTLVLLVKGRGFGATFHPHQIRKDDVKGLSVSIDLPRVAPLGGRVFDPGGRPIRDALVVIVPDGMDRGQFEQVSSFLFGAEKWDDGAGARWPAVRSGSDGRWKVENAPRRAGGTLRAIDPAGRFAPSALVRFNMARGNTAKVNLHLKPGVTVAGTVENDSGDAVAAATVYIGGVRAKTGPDGGFTLKGVPVGETDAAIRHPLHLLFRQKVIIPAEGIDRFVATITRGAVVVGTVINTRGDSVIGARVSARTRPDARSGPAGRHLKTVTTGPDGAYALGGFTADQVDIVARAEGYEPRRLADVVPDTAPLTLRLSPVEWTLGGDVTGRLIDALTRAPIINGTLERVDPGRVQLRNDEFLIQNEPPGPFELVISAPGHQQHRAKGLDVPSGGTLDLGLIEMFPCGELRVPLRDAKNKQYNGPSKIRLVEKQAQRNPNWARLPTRAGAEWVFPQLRPGLYEVIVTIEGKKPFRRPVMMDRPKVTVRVKLR